jgi:hypothetical protein
VIGGKEGTEVCKKVKEGGERKKGEIRKGADESGRVSVVSLFPNIKL